MPSYRTMMVAQSLYEGVDVPGAGLVGLITYMRTDSVRVADEAVAAAREHIRTAHGEAYLPPSPHVYRNRKSAQDAHEAIRPTSMEFPPAKVKPILNRDQYRLYELIWNRFIASRWRPRRSSRPPSTSSASLPPANGPFRRVPACSVRRGPSRGSSDISTCTRRGTGRRPTRPGKRREKRTRRKGRGTSCRTSPKGSASCSGSWWHRTTSPRRSPR